MFEGLMSGKNLVGVDIGSSSIKVIQLREGKGTAHVERFGYIPLPAQTIVDGHIMNQGAVTEALNKVFADSKITKKDVAVGVYGQSVIVRKITIPIMTPQELEQQIEWEARQHIPFDMKVMSFDYEVLRRRPDVGQMDVLIVAAKRDEIIDFSSVLKDAKLKPAVVDINAFCVQNIYEHQLGLSQPGSVAIINVGASVTSLNMLSDGVSAFSREINNAGNTITEEIQKQCSVPHEQAEAYKCGGGPTDIVPQEVHQVISGACDALAGEIQRSLDFYLATTGEAEVGKIVVCGGSAYLAPLTKAIERRARVSVQLFDPTSHLTVDSKFVNEQAFRARASQFVVALGLSLRSEKEKRTL
jgi:type IV pilus assembly protein PilM